MGNLYKYAETSKVMEIKVSYNGEVFEFNVYKELKIDKENMIKQLKNHATSYAFVAMLHKKILIKHKELHKKLSAKKTRMIPIVKKNKGYTSLKEAEAYLVTKDKKVKSMERSVLELEELKDLLEVCVRSFEIRKDLLQTISANIRNER